MGGRCEASQLGVGSPWMAAGVVFHDFPVFEIPAGPAHGDRAGRRAFGLPLLQCDGPAFSGDAERYASSPGKCVRIVRTRSIFVGFIAAGLH